MPIIIVINLYYVVLCTIRFLKNWILTIWSLDYEPSHSSSSSSSFSFTSSSSVYISWASWNKVSKWVKRVLSFYSTVCNCLSVCLFGLCLTITFQFIDRFLYNLACLPILLTYRTVLIWNWFLKNKVRLAGKNVKWSKFWKNPQKCKHGIKLNQLLTKIWI